MTDGQPSTIRDVRPSARGRPNRTVESRGPTIRRSRERPVTVMLSAAKHLALLFVGGKVQSEILRSAPLRCAQNDMTLGSFRDGRRNENYVLVFHHPTCRADPWVGLWPGQAPALQRSRAAPLASQVEGECEIQIWMV